eukprot:tig00000769_g4024.t1
MLAAWRLARARGVLCRTVSTAFGGTRGAASAALGGDGPSRASAGTAASRLAKDGVVVPRNSDRLDIRYVQHELEARRVGPALARIAQFKHAESIEAVAHKLLLAAIKEQDGASFDAAFDLILSRSAYRPSGALLHEAVAFVLRRADASARRAEQHELFPAELAPGPGRGAGAAALDGAMDAAGRAAWELVRRVREAPAGLCRVAVLPGTYAAITRRFLAASNPQAASPSSPSSTRRGARPTSSSSRPSTAPSAAAACARRPAAPPPPPRDEPSHAVRPAPAARLRPPAAPADGGGQYFNAGIARHVRDGDVPGALEKLGEMRRAGILGSFRPHTLRAAVSCAPPARPARLPPAGGRGRVQGGGGRRGGWREAAREAAAGMGRAEVDPELLPTFEDLVTGYFWGLAQSPRSRGAALSHAASLAAARPHLAAAAYAGVVKALEELRDWAALRALPLPPQPLPPPRAPAPPPSARGHPAPACRRHPRRRPRRNPGPRHGGGQGGGGRRRRRGWRGGGLGAAGAGACGRRWRRCSRRGARCAPPAPSAPTSTPSPPPRPRVRPRPRPAAPRPRRPAGFRAAAASAGDGGGRGGGGGGGGGGGAGGAGLARGAGGGGALLERALELGLRPGPQPYAALLAAALASARTGPGARGAVEGGGRGPGRRTRTS